MRGGEQDFCEGVRIECTNLRLIRKSAFHKALQYGDFPFGNRDVCVGAFLNIDQTDFYGPAVKARDGSTAIQEEMVQQMVGIVRRDICLHAVENLFFVILVGKHCLGNHFAGNARDFFLVVAVGFYASVQVTAVLAV